MKEGGEAVLFDIQRFALNDGPGIRTLIFFKGCPLRCIWCHNPESLSSDPEYIYFSDKCSGCGCCATVCPNQVHVFQDGIHQVDYTKCKKCGNCLSVCCYSAVSILGSRYSVADIIRQVETDRQYYGDTGGVTLSGGEPMFQAELAIPLAKELKARNIGVCIETCGYAKTNLYKSIAPYVDQFLIDYKATPPEEHKRLTGVTSDLILKNIHLLNQLGKEMVLRCPMIPGVNDTDNHLRAIANIAESYRMIGRVEVLPYHSMGEVKRLQMGKKRSLQKPGNATEEQKQVWIQRLAEFGCKAYLA